jgi:hypothetical protein
MYFHEYVMKAWQDESLRKAAYDRDEVIVAVRVFFNQCETACVC